MKRLLPRKVADIGLSVLVKGTTTGTVIDINGKILKAMITWQYGACHWNYFNEISMRSVIDHHSPYTFYFGYANGWLGYLALNHFCIIILKFKTKQ